MQQQRIFAMPGHENGVVAFRPSAEQAAQCSIWVYALALGLGLGLGLGLDVAADWRFYRSLVGNNAEKSLKFIWVFLRFKVVDGFSCSN